MKLKHLMVVLAVAIAFPSGAALANNTAAGPSSGGSPKLSTSSSDLINQNQQSVTNNDTTQAATGVVQQSANYNIGQAASYDFRGIAGTRAYCPKPALLFSGSSSFSSRASSNNLSAALVVPLGGKAARNCTKISTQILKEQEQHLLHTNFNNQFQIASRCTSLLKSGASINAEVFPELAQFCDGISLAQGGGELTPEPQAKLEPKAPPAVIIPPPPPAVRSSY